MELISLVMYLIGLALGLLILHAIIRNAVSAALAAHYKTVRWYEKTGEWAGEKHPPRSFDAGPINPIKK